MPAAIFAHSKGCFAKNFYGIKDAFLTLKNRKGSDSSHGMFVPLLAVWRET